MKHSIIGWLILQAFFSATAFSQPPGLVVRDLRDQKVLSTLFDSDKIDSNGDVLWLPNFAEGQEFNVSYDSLCHTNLDTIMEFQGYQSTEAALIFTTYWNADYRTIEDCHACAPDIGVAIFSKNTDGSWRFDRMRKHLIRYGAWGQMQDVALRKIGEHQYALDLSGSYGGQGVMESHTFFYSLETFDEIFSAFTHEDNSGATDDESKLYDWDKDIEIRPSKKASEYYEIVVTKSGRGQKIEGDYDSPLVKLSGKEIYRFDDRIERYVLAK